MASDRSQPGVSDTAVAPWGSSSCASANAIRGSPPPWPGRRRTRPGSCVALYSSVPSVTSTTRPPGVLMSSGSAKWLVMAWVSTAEAQRAQPDVQRRTPRPSCSTPSSWRPRCRSRGRAARPARPRCGRPARRTSSGTRWSTCTAMPRPPAVVDQRGGLLDRLRPVHLRPLRPRRAPGHVDGRAGRAELHRDPSPGRPGAAGDQRDPARQRFTHAANVSRALGS